MTRNPNYHKENKPYLDAFEFVAITDPTARANAFVTGEIDFMNDLEVNNIPLVNRSSDLEVLRVPSLRHFSFDMGTTTPPFDNPDVRMDIKYAIDRKSTRLNTSHY